MANALAFSLILFAGSVSAQLPTDVPRSSPAAEAVNQMVKRGIMPLQNGKFNGAGSVTRNDLSVILCNFAKDYLKAPWPKTIGKPAKLPVHKGELLSKPVTRYELADTLWQIGQYMANGLPANKGQVFLKTESLPVLPDKTVIVKDHPSRAAVEFMVKNHMIWQDSKLLKPSKENVTGLNVAEALVEVVVGINDRLTDEPQNREELAPPPSRKK